MFENIESIKFFFFRMNDPEIHQMWYTNNSYFHRLHFSEELMRLKNEINHSRIYDRDFVEFFFFINYNLYDSTLFCSARFNHNSNDVCQFSMEDLRCVINKSIYLMFCCWEWKEQWWMCKYSTYSRRFL